MAFRADPRRHARHALKALISFHVMEVGHEPLPALQRWLLAAPLYPAVWLRLGSPGGSLAAYGQTLVEELCTAGVLQQREGEIFSV